MKVLRASKGEYGFMAEVGDIYVNDLNQAYRRLAQQTKDDPIWAVLGHWDEAQPLTEHEQYYLRQSLGLSDDVSLEDE